MQSALELDYGVFAPLVGGLMNTIVIEAAYVRYAETQVYGYGGIF